MPEFGEEAGKAVEPVHIHTASAVIDAELIVASLKAGGVRAFAKGSGAEFYTDAGGIGQMSRIPGPLNEIRIMVHPDDEMDARRVLSEADARPPEVEEGGPPQKWSLHPTKRKLALKIFALVILVPIVYGLVASLVEIL